MSVVRCWVLSCCLVLIGNVFLPNTWDSLSSGNELYCVDSANSCLLIIPSTDPTHRWNMRGSMVFQIGQIGDVAPLTTRGIVHRYHNKRSIPSAMRSQVYKISKPRYCK
ncbi:hypothetical protein BD769DRAFT_1484272 [Suillus cothurnatus]|nr:hypothetical protein BD769DRAFT_1484272 [Suillus cothurnatus]